MTITLTQQGPVWVASDGTHHVESDSPEEALYLLQIGQIDQEFMAGGSVDQGVSRVRAEQLEEKIGGIVIGLVRLLTLRAPPDIVRSAMKNLSANVEQLLENYDD